MQDSPILLPWYDQSEDRVFFSYRYDDSIAEPLVMAPHQKGDRARPTFSLSVEQTQELVDRLYGAGFVPTSVTQAPAIPPTETGALQKHLDDMRTLVFEALVPLIPKVVE